MAGEWLRVGGGDRIFVNIRRAEALFVVIVLPEHSQDRYRKAERTGSCWWTTGRAASGQQAVGMTLPKVSLLASFGKLLMDPKITKRASTKLAAR